MPRKSQTCNICWQSGCSICPIHLQSTSMSSCPTKSTQDALNTQWPMNNKEQSSLVLRAIVPAQHPGDSRTDPGRPEAVMHRANYALQHHVQHPYKLHQRSRRRTACPLVKLLLQHGRIFSHQALASTCVKGSLCLPALSLKSVFLGSFSF